MDVLSRKLHELERGRALNNQRNAPAVNDIEIVCMNEDCQRYAETIEKRIIRIGFKVDILFPSSIVPVHVVLTNIAQRGVKFALVIHLQHEINGSLNLHQLQDDKQEYSNISVDDAVRFMTTRLPKPQRLLPSEISTKLAYLKLGRPLSIKELDKLIKYIVERRMDSLRLEYGDSVPRHLVDPPVGPEQDPELKSAKESIRKSILEILDTADMPPPQPQAVIPQQQQSSSNVVQINNQQLMAALNNLNPTFLDAVKSLSGVVGGGGGSIGGNGGGGAVMSTDMFSRR